MVLYLVFYRVAFLTTALIHLWWHDLIRAAVAMVVVCLSNARRPLIQSILRLHSLVLICFVLGFCFQAVSAAPEQATLQGRPILNVSPSDEVSRWTLKRVVV